MPKPSVRVVIPCFNHGRWVREAVDSALALADAEVEVAVVDDGSDDGTSPAACDACAGPRVTVVHRANGGLSAARNTGAAGAATEYLAFLDADDLLLPHFARDLAAAVEREIATGRGDDVSHAYGFEQVTGLHELVWRCPPWDPIRMLIANLHPVTALVRRSCFERAGGFDESMREGHEDWEFWIRCVGHGWRGVRIETPTFVWRRFSNESLLHTALDAHDANVRRILARHVDLYRTHALAVIERAFAMLHEADATWLDDDFGPIHVRNRRAYVANLEAAIAVATAERDAARDEAAEWRSQLDALRADFEANPAVVAARRMHAAAERLPAPLGRLLVAGPRAVSRIARRILGA